MKIIKPIILIFLCNLPFWGYAQSMQDEMLSTAEQQMNRIIELMDASGDKSVSSAEYRVYHNQQAVLYDRDINQRLSLDEYKQWIYGSLLESASQNAHIKYILENERFEIDEAIEDSFARFDVNKDENIDKEELNAIHQYNMEKADLNNDQLLNKEDVEKLKALMRSQKKSM